MKDERRVKQRGTLNADSAAYEPVIKRQGLIVLITPTAAAGKTRTKRRVRVRDASQTATENSASGGYFQSPSSV